MIFLNLYTNIPDLTFSIVSYHKIAIAASSYSIVVFYHYDTWKSVEFKLQQCYISLCFVLTVVYYKCDVLWYIRNDIYAQNNSKSLRAFWATCVNYSSDNDYCSSYFNNEAVKTFVICSSDWWSNLFGEQYNSTQRLNCLYLWSELRNYDYHHNINIWIIYFVSLLVNNVV